MVRKLYTLEVRITDGPMTDEFVRANPVVSRTIEIRADQTLDQLHRAIFEAFDRWDDRHRREFQFGPGPHGPDGPRRLVPHVLDGPFGDRPAAGTIGETRPDDLNLDVGRSFGYRYDFGDNWCHEIRVLAIGEVQPGVEYPRVVARIGDSPPQYIVEE